LVPPKPEADNEKLASSCPKPAVSESHCCEWYVERGSIEEGDVAVFSGGEFLLPLFA
jgi:hypothetical protein